MSCCTFENKFDENTTNAIDTLGFFKVVPKIIEEEKITNRYFSEGLNRFFYFKYDYEKKGYHMIGHNLIE